MSAAEVWTLFSILGAIVSMYSLFDAWARLDEQRSFATSGMLLLAHGDIRAERTRLLIQLLWASLGALALFAGIAQGWSVYTAGLVVSNALLLYKSADSIRTRLQLRRMFSQGTQ